MRSFLIVLTGAMLFAGSAAQAKVSILVDKNNQTMTVSVDGIARYHWPISTGIPSYETPNGSFRTFRMEADHFSKEFDDAPMPHSIFFTKIGHAIHGTVYEGKLGTPASHGCVRLSRQNASTLYALVEQEGVLNTTVTLTGSSQIALARNPRGNVAMARGVQQPGDQYTAPGYPVDLSPQAVPGRRGMQDSGYIYPADGSDNSARYPAPRPQYGAQVYQTQPQQRQYYDPGTGTQQQGYGTQGSYYQPRQYYQPRTYFNNYQN